MNLGFWNPRRDSSSHAPLLHACSPPENRIVTHFFQVLDTNVVLNQMDLLETPSPALSYVIVLQTVIQVSRWDPAPTTGNCVFKLSSGMSFWAIY